ncbi:dihydrolipoyl dehydrogenase [Candidatus Omnitrophota bacterium]
MDYDLVVIGAGWAGFTAALKAKELGLKVALIERKDVGGTCLNRGCIPTKALVQSAKVYSLVKKSKIFGIDTVDPKVNFGEIQRRKDKVIQQLRTGIESMLKGIDLLYGGAELSSCDTIKVNDKEIKARFIIIATGSKPLELPQIRFDHEKILSSDDILNLKDIPGKLLVIGGGVIGCEFASIFSSLGSQVHIVEKMPQLLPLEDKDIARKLETAFKKRKIGVCTNTDASTVKPDDYDKILLCVSRTPDTAGLGLEKCSIKTEKGKILVDEHLATNVSNIYAAGDCTGKVMLAHYAAYQGEICAENIVNSESPKKADNTNIPNCIFTDPEISSVGLNEEQAKNKGVDAAIHKFDFLGSGMARILDETDGFIKIVSDKKTNQILGASIIGPKATELIGVLTLAVSSSMKTSQVKEVIFAHPTLSESIKEALG